MRPPPLCGNKENPMSNEELTMSKEQLTMSKTAVLMIALTVMAMIPACAEKDFTAKPVDGGKGVEITGYVGDRFEVRIPPRIQNLPVTSIGEKAFFEKNIISVTMPNSVTRIGRAAFASCTSLANVTIPSSVTSIGMEAFAYCRSLASISIPNGVTSIGDSAFSGCSSLASVTIPSSVTSIGDSAFYLCTSLTSVTFQGTIPSTNFVNYNFPGDLRTKYLAGGIGTYTTTNPGENAVWTKTN
jgi:hypothetical protein